MLINNQRCPDKDNNEYTLYDAIITGAGIAGLACSVYLSRAGFKVCVIERKKEIGYPVCCGEAVSKKSLHDSGFYHPSYIDSKVKGYRVYYPDDNYMEVDSQGYLLNRGAFEKYLCCLAEKSGVKILLKTPVLSCFQDREKVTVKTSCGVFEGKYLIAADGPESLCASFFSPEKNKWLPAAQYRIKENGVPGACKRSEFLGFYYDSLSPYYFWNFEKSGYSNIGGCVSDKTILCDFINKRFTGGDRKIHEFVRGKIPAGGLKKKIVFGRVALIGDAAGSVNPVSLAGIYGALMSAKLSAEAAVLSLKTGVNSMSKYEKDMKKSNFTRMELKYLAKKCSGYPEKALLFLGGYFTGRKFHIIDIRLFLKMLKKYPVVLKYLIPMFIHRNLLIKETDNMW